MAKKTVSKPKETIGGKVTVSGGGGGGGSRGGTSTGEDGQLKYTKGKFLGKGAFGAVHMGLLENGKLVAIKQVELGNIPSEAELKQFEHELELMKTLHHENIVEYIGCERDTENNNLNIILEYVPGGSLCALLKNFGTLSDTTIRRYTKQILQGLHYLHENGIVHRDIKGDNILADDKGMIKLADFGCSKQLNELCDKTHGCNTMVGTPYWMAPEVISDDTGYGFKADIWSVGCTVCEMMTGTPPWPEFESMWAAIYHIANCVDPPPGIPEDICDDAKSFLDSCFQRDVSKRSSSEELLVHPYIKDY